MFETILPGLLGLLGGLLASPSATPAADDPLSARQAAEKIRWGNITSEALTRELLARAEVHRGLNAFISLDEEKAIAAARAADATTGAKGPLHGVPIVVKDNINSASLPTTGGTPSLRDFRPSENAPVLQKLLDAGAILLGKTNLHELAFGITSNNAGYGAVGNAYDPSRFAGGSSGGTGAAIGAGIAPAGLGTDTGARCASRLH